MTKLTYVPNRIIDSNGISDGGAIYVYQAGTTTPVNLFTDAAFSSATTNPHVVLTGALVPPLYTNYAGNVRLRVVSDTGEVLIDEDPYVSYLSVNEISDETGASIVGTDNRWNAPYFTALDALVASQTANVFWWIPPAEWAAIQDNTSTTDHSTYIQAAIDALNANGGGTLKFPDGRYNANVVIKSGVALVGSETHPSATVAQARRVSWYAAANGYCIDTPAAPGSGTSIEGGTIKGFQFNGEHGTYSAEAIRIRSARKFFLHDCAFNNFSGSAVIQDQPSGFTNGTLEIERCFAQNCLLDNASLTDYKGVFELRGSDGLIDWVESAGSILASSVTGFVTAFIFGGSDWKATNILGEFADVNFYFTSLCSRGEFINLTGDNSFGHNYLMDGAVDNVVHGLAKRTGQGLHNTYDGFHLTGSAARNEISIKVVDVPSTATKARYGIYDGFSTTDKHNRNNFTGCKVKSGAAATLNFFSNSLTGGSAMPVEIGAAISVTGATPDVNGIGLVRHTGGVSVTNFLNGTAGQEFTFLAGSDVTITRGASTIETMTKANKYLRSGHSCRFRNYNGTWYEVGGDSSINTSASWDAPSIATGAQASTTVAVTGAVLGDFVLVSASGDPGAVSLTARVTAADTVTIYLVNNSGIAVDPASLTYYIRVIKKG